MLFFPGEYYLGFRHGRGQLIYPNNVLYVGEWKWDKVGHVGVCVDVISVTIYANYFTKAA